MLEQCRLNENISVAIQMRSCSGNTRASSCSVCRQSSDDASCQEQQLTAGDLRDMSNNPELSDSCYGFMHNIKGTIAYWLRILLYGIKLSVVVRMMKVKSHLVMFPVAK